ncbi:MAG: ABC transporter substrate-binding protein [Methylobacter sp.]|jgi:phospholipid transport system substrate-binding protein
MKTKQYAVLGLFAVLLGLMPVTKAVADELLPPQQVIQGVSAEIKERLRDKSFTQDFAQVTRFVNGVIDPHADFDRIAALVLGKIWKTATPAEQERFKREFQTLLVRTYSRAFVEYKEWSIRFPPLTMESGATKIIVKTEVMQPGIQPVEVSYRMVLSQGQWKVYDIIIEGVSLVTNYRTTFSEEVKTKGSLSAVIDGLVKRNAEALAPKKS